MLIQNWILKKRKLQHDFSCLWSTDIVCSHLNPSFFKSLTLVSAFHSNLPFGRCCAWWGGEGFVLCDLVLSCLVLSCLVLACLVLSGCIVLSCLHCHVLSFELNPPPPPPPTRPRLPPCKVRCPPAFGTRAISASLTHTMWIKRE